MAEMGHEPASLSMEANDGFGSTAVHPVSRGAALADGIGRLAERFAGLARRSCYPHSETPGAVSPLYRHSAREIRTITESPPDAPRATTWQNA
jgi:hypothetical protein